MNQSKSHNPSNSHIIFIVIGLAILLVVIGHAVAAVSLFKSGIDGSFIRNPIFLVMIILMLIIIPFKFKHISGFLHKKIE
jgi:membrane protein YdbS with pleckstrin-like domain